MTRGTGGAQIFSGSPWLPVAAAVTCSHWAAGCLLFRCSWQRSGENWLVVRRATKNSLLLRAAAVQDSVRTTCLPSRSPAITVRISQGELLPSTSLSKPWRGFCMGAAFISLCPHPSPKAGGRAGVTLLPRRTLLKKRKGGNMPIDPHPSPKAGGRSGVTLPSPENNGF